MKLIDRNNIEEFLEYYHNFHDATIESAIYDCSKATAKVIIKTFWVGENEIHYGKVVPKNKLIKIVFNDVEKINIREMFSYDYIMEIYFKFITLDNKEFMCFADNDTNPNFYCVCESMEYDELN